MSPRFTSPLTFLLALMLLVGCQMPVVQPTDITGSETPPSVTPELTPPTETPEPIRPTETPVGQEPHAVLLEEACKSYMDVNLKQAYERFDFPIFWTFHTTFYQPFPQNNADLRLGCLRFYWRDDSASTFVGTLKSALLIECASVNGNLDTQSIFPSISSSSGLRSSTDSTLPHRRTIFEADAHLECPLDINDALSQVIALPGFIDDLALLSSSDQTRVQDAIPVMLAKPDQEYGEFMMAAAIESNDNQQTDSIIFYQPDPSTSLSPAEIANYQIELSLVHDEFAHISDVYATQLGGWQVDSSVSGDGADCIARPGLYYLWESFGSCVHSDGDDCMEPAPQNNVFLQFLTISSGSGLSQCRIDAGLIPFGTVPFWTGRSILYVGHNPITLESITKPLTLFEIWLDPDSSVKPSQ